MIDVLYPPLVLVAGVIGIGLGAVAWRYRRRPGARPLAVFAVAAGCWTIAEGFALVRGGLDTSQFWQQVGLSFSVALPVAWLALVLAYTGSQRRLTRGLAGALLLEPAAFLGLLWTADRHDLVWTGGERVAVGEFDAFAGEFGLAFWGHQAYSYLLLSAGVFLLVRMLFHSNRLFRWQSTAWLFAISVPMTVNTLSLFGLLPSGLDPTGLGYVLASALLALALFESQLHSIAPATREIGREAVLAELDDAILILDGEDRVVDANPAAKRLLDAGVEPYLGQPLGEVRPSLAAALEDADGQAGIDLEDGGRIRHYDVRISPLYRAYGALSGRVVSLRDVTERQQREQRLDVLNRLLRHNIRNELNLVRGQIELARPTVAGEEGDERLGKAIDAVDGIVARSDKVGRLSRLLETEGTGSIDIAMELRAERRAGGLSQLDGEIRIDLPEQLYVGGGQSLIAAFDELIENGIRHNDSGTARVTIAVDGSRSDDSQVVITVSDNGPGINDQERQTIADGEETVLKHSSGVGLWLVNWVVRRAGGTVSFEDSQPGSTVAVTLPRVEPASGESLPKGDDSTTRQP